MNITISITSILERVAGVPSALRRRPVALYAARHGQTDRTPGQPARVAPSRSSAHAEGSITEDDVAAAARERAVDIGAGAVTPAVGALLSLLARLTGGKAVVEVGTGAGVSGLWLLAGMREDGVLTTIDIEPEHQRLAKEAFTRPASGRRGPG